MNRIETDRPLSTNQRLRQLMRNHELSRIQVAKDLGKGKGTIDNYLSRGNPVPKNDIRLLEYMYEVKPSQVRPAPPPLPQGDSVRILRLKPLESDNDMTELDQLIDSD